MWNINPNSIPQVTGTHQSLARVPTVPNSKACMHVYHGCVAQQQTVRLPRQSPVTTAKLSHLYQKMIAKPNPHACPDVDTVRSTHTALVCRHDKQGAERTVV